MAKFTAKNGIILTGGYNYSPYVTAYDGEHTAGMIDVTGFSEGGQNFIPGLPTGKMNVTMLWDNTALTGAPITITSGGVGNVTVIPEGYTLGAQSLSMPYLTANYSPSGEPAGALQLGTFSFEGSGSTFYGIERGVMLAHQTITNTTTTNGVDDPTGAAVTAICAATLHIWKKCATDTYVVKVQHSTDDNTYADLITFTANASIRTSERIVVASGTVNRYRRIVATRTGAAANPFGFSVHMWRA